MSAEGISVPFVPNRCDEPNIECRHLAAFPGILLFSNGNVYNIKTGNFLQGQKLDLRSIGLGKPTKSKLIVRAFVPKPENERDHFGELIEACSYWGTEHINSDKQDFRASNLRWEDPCSAQDACPVIFRRKI